MRLGISVVICSYNGAALLPDTLRHVAQQQVQPGIDWEVVVIDNASTDATSEVALAEWATYGTTTPLHVFFEPKQGLTHARELAFKKSKYEFVLFCDDDNWLHPAYIATAYHIMAQHPNIGILGGHGTLIFEEQPPAWALGHGFYANGAQAPASGKVPSYYVYGAGCVARRSAYNKLMHCGFRPMLTDRAGGRLSSGGDYELCYAFALAGYDMWYDSRLTFQHFMPAVRTKWAYLQQFIKEGPQCYEVIMPYRIRISRGAHTHLTFYLGVFYILLSYTAKALGLYLRRLHTPKRSDESKRLSLKLTSLTYKILAFRGHRVMYRNFGTVLQLEQRLLKANEKPSASRFLKKAGIEFPL
ncbi:glycosyltransferase [Pontibacter mangrovi]|uniref:Glycosyltransferase family 2 protein n=1 Tax=Pontibacter mangrovi TaxID=2589816 RepID=A0A501W192_9BACT|nr:glycosyltransferase [Pontibacter mangrovi]TPE42502.1 glycosyltransferase family 2 protein [Pontibacter mangrovi]